MRIQQIFLALAAVALSLCTAACSNPPSTASADEPGMRNYRFTYEAVVRDIPETAESAYLWIPYPPTTADQEIHAVNVDSATPYEELAEARYGNRVLRIPLKPGEASQRIVMEVDLTRHERLRWPGSDSSTDEAILAGDPGGWLGPDRRVPIDGKIREWAEETTAGHHTPLERARAIYDYAVGELKYDKSGTGWGNGDIYWACDAKRGNCTDFHALFIGFNRAVGIPARFEMGFPIPADRGAGEIGGYHCWAQFHVDGHGWIPVDASEANKHPEKREYFFGAHDENRLLLSVGRDLTLPRMQGDPLNFFVYPYVEVDGKPFKDVEKRFAYRDL